MSEENKKHVPTRYKIAQVSVVPEADVPTLVRDALSIIADEIYRFKKTSNSNKPLSLSESRVLQGYIKCLVDLSKEQREAHDGQDLANISNDELLKLIDKLKKPEPEND